VTGSKGTTGTKGATGAQGPASQVVGGGTAVAGTLVANGFMGMFVSGSSTTEAQVQQPMPVAGTLKNFTIRLDAVLSGGTSITYTVRKNGVATALTCTITTASAAVTCSDVTHTASFAAGDLISIGSARSGTPAAQGTRWTAQYQ
jgi:hypothetical protein